MSGSTIRRAAPRPLGRAREEGYAVFAAMVGVAIVSVALANQALLAGYGALAARGAKNQLACRQAALALLNAAPPAAAGGSVAPAAPVDGWSDTVTIDSQTGAVAEAAARGVAGAVLIARQWRRGADAAGREVYEVSATAAGGSGEPLPAWLRAEVVLSRRVR